MGNESCSCSCGCCSTKEKIVISIDFLYLDLSICTRCQGTEAILEDAIKEVSMVLNAADIDVKLSKINITSKELAIAYKFESSPTIRINGNDIDVDIKENSCDSCGDLCGDSVDCRVWIYNGEEFSVPPKSLIVKAILKEVFGEKRQVILKDYILPDNLNNFFNAIDSNKGECNNE